MINVAILSFSYKHGLPEDSTGNGGGFVFDCRAMPNPFWDETLRGYTGRDEQVKNFFARIPEKVEPFLDAAEHLVRQSVDQYKQDGREYLQVAFGCTGNAPAAKRSGCLNAKREPRRGCWLIRIWKEKMELSLSRFRFESVNLRYHNFQLSNYK